MRVVVQRVDYAKVSVGGQEISSIGRGILILLGVEKSDGKMNLSLLEISGSMLVVSQFTLLADCRKGRRPSFGYAAEPELASELYEYFVKKANSMIGVVKEGKFQEMMKIELANNGPVTIILDSRKGF
jgi:D-tyrosyl-tRNA(Tyr) deacylase